MGLTATVSSHVAHIFARHVRNVFGLISNGDPLPSDGRLRKLSPTGSTPVGPALPRAYATRCRSDMELGGMAPFITFEAAVAGDAGGRHRRAAA